MKKMMPTEWELPESQNAINFPQSQNPTINLCDAIVRKANMIEKNFRGTR